MEPSNDGTHGAWYRGPSEQYGSGDDWMTVYIALLRGINVGGHNKVKMAELKRVLEAMGLNWVQTYIQSGNVLFESGEEAEPLRKRIGPDSQWEAERIADLFLTFLNQQKGFRGIKYLADYDNGEYASISFWETEADLVASLEVVHPKLQDLVGSRFQWEPSYQVFKVYEPKSQ